MAMILAGFITAALMWIVGDILDRRQQAKWDREYFERWGKPRR